MRISCFFLVLLFFNTLQAQTNADTIVVKKHVIKINPVFFEKTAIVYEYLFKNHTSIEINIFAMPFGNMLNSKGFTIDYKFYKNDKPNGTGFHLGPYVKFRNLKENFNLTNEIKPPLKITNLGFGLLTGYQYIRNSGFTYDFFAGIGAFPLLIDHYKYPINIWEENFNKFYYRLDLRLGVHLGVNK